MEYQMDLSGINSLAGYEYQIKVFALYTFKLSKGMSIEFESIEDINLVDIRKINEFDSNIIFKPNNEAIQVKHTSLTKKNYEKMMFNWLLLENSNYEINKYILVTKKCYGNSENIFEEGTEKLFKKIVKSNKKENALISKVKEIYKENYNSFKLNYENIKKKYEFKNIDDIDKLIEDAASIHFRKEANETVFKNRLDEFLKRIRHEILDKVSKKEMYKMSFQHFIKTIEEISNNFTESKIELSYSDFKASTSVDLEDEKIVNSREFIQLKACKLPNKYIEKYLLQKIYYTQTQTLYLESTQPGIVENILEITYENFEDSKLELQKKKEDTPFNRLNETKSKTNAYAIKEPIKIGAAIYLTRDKEEERQISWEDDENRQY